MLEQIPEQHPTAVSRFKPSLPEREAELDNGVLIERSIPDYIHSYIQSGLAHLLITLFALNTKYSVCSELRMSVRKDIVRLLDICVLDYRPAPNTAPTQPPVAAIEIVSEDDRYSDVLRKLREHHEWGVPHVWLIDPQGEQSLTLPEFNFAVTLKELLPPE